MITWPGLDTEAEQRAAEQAHQVARAVIAALALVAVILALVVVAPAAQARSLTGTPIPPRIIPCHPVKIPRTDLLRCSHRHQAPRGHGPRQVSR